MIGLTAGQDLHAKLNRVSSCLARVWHVPGTCQAPKSLRQLVLAGDNHVTVTGMSRDDDSPRLLCVGTRQLFLRSA